MLVLSSIMKPHAVPIPPAWDTSPHFVQHIPTVHTPPPHPTSTHQSLSICLGYRTDHRGSVMWSLVSGLSLWVLDL